MKDQELLNKCELACQRFRAGGSEAAVFSAKDKDFFSPLLCKNSRLLSYFLAECQASKKNLKILNSCIEHEGFSK